MKIVVAFLLLLLASVLPSQAWLRHGGGVAGGGGYTYVCSLMTCTYAFSITHSLVSGASTDYTLTNVTASTTQAIGFDSSHNVNAATIKSFCGSSPDCRMASITDQVAGVCVPFNSTVAQQPLLLWWPATNTPVYADTNDTPSGDNIFQVLSSEPLGSPSTICNAFVGGPHAMSLVYVTSDLWQNTLGANVGLAAPFTTPGTGDLFGGLDFSQTFSGNTICPVSSYCVGLDSQIDQNYYATIATGGIHVNTVTYDGNNPGTVCVYRDSTSLGCGTSTNVINNLQADMNLGWPSNGSQIVFDWAFAPNVMTGTQITNVTNALASYYSGRSAGPSLPGDLIFPSGVNVPQQSYMASGWSCSWQQSLSYYGPACNLCQGVSGTCMDIGFTSTGLFDVATANSFCGPSNCRIQRIYNEGIALAFHNTNTHDSANQDMVAATAAERPSLTFNCDGAGTPCAAGNGSEWLCAAGSNAINQAPASVAVVAERTGGFTSLASALGSGTNQNYLMGFGASPNTGFAEGYQFGGTTLTMTSVADSTVHSMTSTVDSVNLNLYVDGVFQTVTSVFGVNTPGGAIPAFCLFANTSAGANPLTGNIYEASIYGGANSGWNLEMSAGQVASLRTNQKGRIAGLP